MTAPDLDALERLREEATPGPWSVEPFPRGTGTWYGRVRGIYSGHSCVVANVDDINDTHLIAAAVNALPALIAAARERDALRVDAHGLALVEAVIGQRGMTDHSTPVHIRVQNVLAEADHAAERQQREQAEQTLREAARQNCDECGGTGRIHSHNGICGCVDVPRLLRGERQRRESVEQREARLRAALARARRFIEYARYELEDGPATAGTQFPTKDCADKELARIDAALAEGQDG